MRNKDLQDMITAAGIALDKISAMDNMMLQGFFSYDSINGNKALIVHDYENYKVCMSIMDDFAKRCNGFCANVGGNKMIFCNENMEGAAFYHILAHETGHLLLGHLDSRKDMRPNQSNLNWQKIEANIFACILFAMDLWNTYSKRI